MTIEDFTEQRILGKGAFGVVLLVKHKKNNKSYALKVIKKRLIFHKSLEDHALLEKSILQENKSPFIIDLKYAF